MDDMDFSTLAARMSAGLDGVRACLILSSDGLSLGAYPESGEQRAREVWDHLQEIGDPQRGFVDIGEEIWVLVRRGPYAGVLITAPAVRPGLAIDKLEFLLRAAEEARAREASELSSPPPRPEATRRPRTSLHEKPKTAPATPTTASAAAPSATPDPATASAAPQPTSRRSRAEASPEYTPPPALEGAAKRVIDVTAEEAPDASSDAEVPPVPEPAPVPQSVDPPAQDVGAPSPSGPSKDPTATRSPDRSPTGNDKAEAAQPELRPSPSRPPTSEGEVDRVALAREFGRLLAEGG